ncbi:hypothetical protein O9H85_12150 [Paenibacillus filicis]|uniref:DUF998 domain-containing protein n=1 Tax=Paenibacillus gyeongsangnamensis TaxID=3388067 RepID=A0ABT4Q8K7_9BACL|nr:hypothetical protein [Paenibacillus filicis]MCZ8513163.1 hypothetical protein [Paenibacillus filicis]
MPNVIKDAIMDGNYEREARFAAMIAMIGALFLLVGTLLHPMHEDPNMPAAAFKEYAADPNWVASHLTQLSGVFLMVASLVLLARRIAGGPAGAAVTLGAVSAAASLAVAAALQAVDGIALKVMVNTWQRPRGTKKTLFSILYLLSDKSR